MDVKENHEKILIIVALVLCAGILFYNAFFIPTISIPSVIYVDSDTQGSAAGSASEASEVGMSSSVSSGSNARSSSGDSSKVNINTATADELDKKLNGIGPAMAEKIIEYRTKIGRFSDIEEIKNVSGIGEKTFEKFKDMICT